MELIIKDELRKLIPPLTTEERSLLHESIVADGCRDALIIWPTEEGDVIVDGHNRYEICKEKNIRFSTNEIEFENLDDVKIWMIDNQMSRRNISDFIKFELIQKKKEILQARGREKQIQTLGGYKHHPSDLSIIDRTEKHDTRKEIAKDLNKSTGWVAMADIVHKKATEEVKDLLRTGEMSVSEAYKNINKPHVSNNSGENEWYTPACYIESARVVMGSIDIDPASSEIANKTVKATKYYTKDDDGLTKEWAGNVWLNPPYAQPLISQFSQAIVEKLTEYTQIIILVNNATDTQWLHQIMKISDAICFVNGRIKFVDMAGNPSGAPLQGQCIIYIGDNDEGFHNEFQKYGLCLRRM